MNSTFKFGIQEIVSLQRQKALRCENSFLVIDLICYCCGIDNESRAKITLQQFYVPSSLLCPFTQEFKNQQRTAEKNISDFPRRRRLLGSGTERNTKHLSNASKQRCSRASNLKETQTRRIRADKHKFSFYRTAVVFTRRKPHPYEHFVLDIDAKVDF